MVKVRRFEKVVKRLWSMNLPRAAKDAEFAENDENNDENNDDQKDQADYLLPPSWAEMLIYYNFKTSYS